jgi:hypothetical protein
MTFLESAAIIGWFSGKISWALLLAWVLLFLFWMAVARRGHKELDNQLKIKFMRVEKVVIPRAFTVFALFIAITVVWVNGATLTKERFQKLIQPAQPIVQTLLSQSFSFNMTISKFIEITIEKKIGTLPAAAKNLAINQTINQLQTQLGFKFKGSDIVSDVIYDYAMSWLERLPESIRLAFPLSATLLIFLTIKGISIFVRWAVVGVAYLLYEFALMSGFATKALESRSREIILLK